MISNHSLSQLIQSLSNSDLHTLWIADENTDANTISQVSPSISLEVITNRYDIAELFKQKGFTTHLNDFEFECLPAFDRIVFPVCKERSLANYCINQAFVTLNKNGTLILLGEKNQGIKTHCKNAGLVFSEKVYAVKTGTAYCGTATKHSNEPTTVLDDQNYSKLQEIDAGAITFLSKPGVFGWDKADAGSELLMEHCFKQLEQRNWSPTSMLDLGCGYGFITLKTNTLKIEKLFSTDNNAAAIRAAKVNFDRLDLNVQATLDDCASQMKERVDLILCNPPFHRGFKTDGELTEKFLSASQRLLHAKGMALWVLNKFIDIESVADNHFQQIENIYENTKFKVLRFTKPFR